MSSGVVYAAWLAGRWQFDRDGQAASSRTPIDRWADCGCARWHALYQGAVGWADSETASRRQRWRCGVRHGRIPSDRTGRATVGVLGNVKRCPARVLRWA